jgi:DNA-binding helix-hairpin-helix protein with protein kinase domain
VSAVAAELRSGGAPLTLGPELGRGGEATIYALTDHPERALKLYRRSDPERGAKLRAMLAHAPDDPGRAGGHVAIAWPEALVEADGEVVGFTMPRLDLRRSLPLHQLYHPGSRRRRAPTLDWRYLVRIARNLCRVVAALHRSGYVIGDLNESNILVSNRALVTLVDLDSVQVRAGGRLYRCPVGKAEYQPPELQGRNLREAVRREAHDRYGLAILIFLLLMDRHRSKRTWRRGAAPTWGAPCWRPFPAPRRSRC